MFWKQFFLTPFVLFVAIALLDVFAALLDILAAVLYVSEAFFEVLPHLSGFLSGLWLSRVVSEQVAGILQPVGLHFFDFGLFVHLAATAILLGFVVEL